MKKVSNKNLKDYIKTLKVTWRVLKERGSII